MLESAASLAGRPEGHKGSSRPRLGKHEMILYQLRCADGHQFEAWFRDSLAFDSQNASGHVECPYCGGTHVRKAPMAPHLARGRNSDSASEARAREVAEQILRAVSNLRRHVEDNCDYVGDKFAEEARDIHYGETEERPIYGEASDDEVQDLAEEGVEFHRLPGLPRRDS